MEKQIQSLNQDLFNIALKHALAELEEEQISESCQVFDDLGKGVPLPGKVQKNIKRLIQPPRIRMLKRIAACLLLVFAVLLGSSTVASALGFNWIRTLFRNQPQYSGLTITDKTREEYRLDEIEGFEVVYLPSYMPGGFELSDVDVSNEFYHLVYLREGEMLMINQTFVSDGGALDYDTEGVTLHEIVGVKGMDKSIYIQKSDYNAVYAIKNDIVLRIEAFPAGKDLLPKEGLIDIAENLEAIDVK